MHKIQHECMHSKSITMFLIILKQNKKCKNINWIFQAENTYICFVLTLNFNKVPNFSTIFYTKYAMRVYLSLRLFLPNFPSFLVDIWPPLLYQASAKLEVLIGTVVIFLWLLITKGLNFNSTKKKFDYEMWCKMVKSN